MRDQPDYMVNWELLCMDGGNVERENLYGKPEYREKYNEMLNKLNLAIQ